MSSRPRNHKELVAELRKFEKYFKTLLNMNEIYLGELKKCPDTQFYFEDVAKGITQANKLLRSMGEYLESSIVLIKATELMENTGAEMKRGADEQSDS